MKTVVFIDYNLLSKNLLLLGIKSKIKKVKEIISGQVDATEIDIKFFANFNHELIKDDFESCLEEDNNNIFHCYDENLNRNYTNMIMLSEVYKYFISSPKTEQFVFITKDKFFIDIALFLKENNKVTGLLYVNNLVNENIKNCCTWSKDIIDGWEENNIERVIILQEIFRNLKWAETKGIKPTITKTVELLAKYSHIKEDVIKQVITGLIKQEYIMYIITEKLKYLEPNWEKINNDFNFIV